MKKNSVFVKFELYNIIKIEDEHTILDYFFVKFLGLFLKDPKSFTTVFFKVFIVKKSFITIEIKQCYGIFCIFPGNARCTGRGHRNDGLDDRTRP